MNLTKIQKEDYKKVYAKEKNGLTIFTTLKQEKPFPIVNHGAQTTYIEPK
jgi:hypothetical protein